MGRASADFSASGRGAPFRRRRSPTPTFAEESTQERTPSSSAASVTQQPSDLPYPGNAVDSYVPVAPLPVFRGDPGECPDAHLDRFDRLCRANGVVTSAFAARIFEASLDGDAALWYKLTAAGAEALSPPPWDAVRAAFVDFFRSPGAADRARAELMTLRQRSGEPVNRYHLRTHGILRRCQDGGADVTDEFLKARFVDGLCAEFRDWVMPLLPETLDEAAALALSLERNESVREARRAAMAAFSAGDRCALCGVEGHEETRCDARKRELLRRSSSSGRGAAAAAKDGEEAEEGGGSMALARLGSALSTRSASCQCRKHQCWKKAVAASEVAGGGNGN
ncbi:hypothetical protein ACP70R_030672 [Stipagrostis hirtigluma subsp. patula]